MVYLLLAVVALALTSQNILKQKFNSKCSTGIYFFSGMISLFAMLFFIAVNRDWYYSAELLLPSFFFALSYAVATVFSVLAISCGSLAETTLIVSCSLLIPSFYGIVFLDEPITGTLLLGTALLIVSLFLTNYEKEIQNKKITVKWVIFVILAFIGNGASAVAQKSKQLYYGEEGNNLFMVVALAMVTVIMLSISFSVKEERTNVSSVVKKGWLLALFCGLSNGFSNYLVIYLNPCVPASVMFPVISAGSVVMVFLYSVFINHEKFNIRQNIGFIVGIISIVLLNI